ncbi:bifunctional 2-C-methyl-D-erythritol 4-phosphate cytidylyltransferase/2-C-methyl-D-erythritol 2,4-cyclodiphosphate synthase [Helicobacter himalayensis]|uniref:bifunctional 2-C-methyl-D-erythritol 4-phosphate cytidylyltransferase/2-C-methyl-D-erythritol 2,4-cyclodiphosphate synthase n=1 Tax=Helicobacter himalayensis TaxID=1591088 RepID=UPI003D6F9589
MSLLNAPRPLPYAIALVLMAAGNSERFANSNQESNLSNFVNPKARFIKKQWLRIGERALWQEVVRNFCAHYAFSEVVITASKQDLFYMQNISEHTIVLGGDSRAQSLKNALEVVKSDFVLVSDVARCNVDFSVIERLLACIDSVESKICAVPYLNVADTAFYKESYLQRESLKLIQTPQLSHTQTLKKLLDSEDYAKFSDESSAFFESGLEVKFVAGSRQLHKLTFGEDLEILQSLGVASAENIIGSGFDVHSFEEGKEMVLGGVKIESPIGFKAHSDGDVALHALSDAILGAMNAGDIGQWFPDTSEEFKGADSKKLLQELYYYARSVGFEVVRCDLTILAQAPKIAPFKQAMKECIAKLLEIEVANVSIKASTTEGLGFIGRKEGVAVSALVTLRAIDWRRI